jgi:hypothetical protein
VTVIAATLDRYRTLRYEKETCARGINQKYQFISFVNETNGLQENKNQEISWIFGRSVNGLPLPCYPRIRPLPLPVG